MGPDETVIGVVSDTHGLLRPAVCEAFRGVARIIHAGDVGDEEIIQQLEQVAPVTAVRGNVDRAPWTMRLPAAEVVEVAGCVLYVLHDRGELDLDPAAAGFQAVITGHSHQPKIEWVDDVLYLNPGSAGPRRFNLPISVALLRIREGRIHPELVTLQP